MIQYLNTKVVVIVATEYSNFQFLVKFVFQMKKVKQIPAKENRPDD